MKIVHLSAEVSPFAKSGGLGDVVGALPIAQAELGHDVQVWLPYYRNAREYLQRHNLPAEWVLDPFTLDVGYRSYDVGVLRTHLPGSLVPVFLVGQDALFDRENIYSTFFGMDDGIIRYAVFVRAAMEALKRLEQVPDVLHTHDWHTTLGNMALKWDDPLDWVWGKTRSVLTIHNIAYQGIYGQGSFVHLGLPERARGGVTWDSAVNLMKGGLQSADAITGVSPRFAHEIMTSDGGFGLDPLLRSRHDVVHGILNGIDPRVWNPRTDRKIPFNYDVEQLEGKLENRRALLAMAGMDRDDRDLVVGVVGRLTNQKGLDMLFPVLWDLINDGIRFVLLGSGEDAMEEQVHRFTAQAPGRFWSYVGFSEELAHMIEAGADAFLMPSRFEPCGLSQMYSLAYGTPPIVRRVGGLWDTVEPYNGHNPERATGFAFDDASPHALRDTARWAHRCYRDPHLWTRIVRNGMQRDFSWHRSAEKYLALYRHIHR